MLNESENRHPVTTRPSAIVPATRKLLPALLQRGRRLESFAVGSEVKRDGPFRLQARDAWLESRARKTTLCIRVDVVDGDRRQIKQRDWTA